MKKNFWLAGILAISLTACVMSENEKESNGPDLEVNVYTHRHYDIDKKIFKLFEKETGIDVNIVDDDADKLMVRLEKEGKNSKCDVFMTVDAGRLVRVKQRGLLQPITDTGILNKVPLNLRDNEGYWIAQTIRARVIAYSLERVDTSQLSTYMDLANPKWKGKVLTRSSDNIYNQSLLASIIAHDGPVKALEWVKGMVANFAREPKGNDKDQVKAIAAGEGDLALVNTYYVGRMLESDDKGEVEAAKKVGLWFPNQKDRGTHINISGAGIAKYSPNKANAEKLIAFMLRDDIQKMFADANNEFPAKDGIVVKELLAAWGQFKKDSLDLQKLGELNNDALKLFNEGGWK